MLSHVDRSMTRAVDLKDRFDTIHVRLRLAESKLASNDHAAPPAMSCDISALQQRWTALYNRLAAAEQILRIQSPKDAQPGACVAPAGATAEVHLHMNLLAVQTHEMFGSSHASPACPNSDTCLISVHFAGKYTTAACSIANSGSCIRACVSAAAASRCGGRRCSDGGTRCIRLARRPSQRHPAVQLPS